MNAVFMDWKSKSVSGSAVYVEEGVVMKETAGPHIVQCAPERSENAAPVLSRMISCAGCGLQ